MRQTEIPLTIKARPAILGGISHLSVARTILGNHQAVRLDLVRPSSHVRHKAPSIRQVVSRVIILADHITHVDSAIDPKTVNVIVIKPHGDIVKDEIPHFHPSIVGSPAPRRLAPLVVVEIDPTPIRFTPTVEPP